MLFLGFISIIQIIFLPGILAIKLFKLKYISPIQKWLYIFCFSLFINYLIISFLTLISLYSIYSLWIIISLEICILVYDFWKEKPKNIFSSTYIYFYKKIKGFYLQNPNYRVIILISGIILLFYFAAFIANIGTIFYFIDTVNNYEWNRWAIDFSNNMLPKYSSHFPQLIPANWSICYVLIGMGDIHFFPKFIMPLFFLNNLLIFFDLALDQKNYIYLVGSVIYGILGPIIFSLVFILDGNADIPVSFFAFMVLYGFVKFSPQIKKVNFISFPKINLENKREIISNYLVVFLFASMAAATKLAGAYIFTITSLVLVILFLSNWKHLTNIGVIWRVSRIVGIVVFALFWYLRSPDEMISGLNQPQYLSPEGYLTIGIHALRLIYFNLGLPVCLFLVFTLGLSLFDKRVRFITLIMVLTPLVIWIFKYSSDFRNLSFVIPFMAFASGVGFTKFLYLFKIAPGPLSTQSAVNETKNIPRLNTKDKSYLYLAITISTTLLLYFIYGNFYFQLYSVYNFFYKYYFLGYRIINFIEYDLLLYVDFYQRTFIALSAFTIIISILILFNVRIITTIILTVITIALLSSTVIDKHSIIDYQKETFKFVEARNYYTWIKTISNNSNINAPVYTNFKKITRDKIPRNIKFRYISDISEKSLGIIEKETCYLFLDTEFLDDETSSYIDAKFKTKQYTLLLGDQEYWFILIKPF